MHFLHNRNFLFEKKVIILKCTIWNEHIINNRLKEPLPAVLYLLQQFHITLRGGPLVGPLDF